VRIFTTCSTGSGPFFQTFLQGLAFHALHDQIIHAVLMSDIVEDANVGMIQAGHGPGLVLEALLAAQIGGKMRGENLDSYVAS
jgi:hypothetical protein